MVKNHARKNDARARQAATGETLPVALRNSVPASGDKPVIHLGNESYLDLNKDAPHLFISGNPKTGKTALAKHILREAGGSGMSLTVFASDPREYNDEFPGVAMVDAGGRVQAADLMLDALATSARGGHRNDIPKLIVIDSLQSISEDGLISLQILARSGRAANIHLVILSQNAPEHGILKSHSHHVVVGRGGFCIMDESYPFRIGEPARSKTSTLKVGDGAQWNIETGNLMILGRPGIGKTELAKQIAREALLSGKKVTVMASRGNDTSWRDTFSGTIPVFSELSADTIDELTARGLDEGGDTRVLIVDGFMIEDESPLTFDERLSQAALINILRGGHVKVVVTAFEANELQSLFGNAVILSNSVPNNEDVMKGLTLNQMTGAERRNRDDDEAQFTHLGVGHGWMIGLHRGVYEKFVFAV